MKALTFGIQLEPAISFGTDQHDIADGDAGLNSTLLFQSTSPQPSQSITPSSPIESSATMSPIVSTGSNSKADAPSTQPSESPSMNPTVELPYPSGTPSESPSLSPVTSSPTDLPSNVSESLAHLSLTSDTVSHPNALLFDQNPSIPPGSTPSFQSSQVPSYSMSPTIDCSAIVARLKIQATTGEHLQMFEVQVYSHKVNVALGGIASQSTTYKGNERFAASKAIDGDNSTFSHTGDTNAYWQVDLGQSRRVHKVIIVNRYCSSDPLCLCRLSYANLILLDDAGGIITTRALGNTCGKLLVDESFKLSCPSGTPSENPSLSPVTSSPTDLPSSVSEVLVFSSLISET